MSILVLRTRAELSELLAEARRRGKRLSVVPTMGALHCGHRALIETASLHGEEVVATVFVNPTQFGPGEDFERYPRTLEQDVAVATAAGATAVFAPSREEMYSPFDQTRVVPGPMASLLCGASRPGHFTGVLTVVTKLMSLLSPGTFVFGRKDFQQLRLIQTMVSDLFFPISIVEHPIVREPDGLALSSRNAYLSPEQRQSALAIPRALARADEAFRGGEGDPRRLSNVARATLEAAGLRVDYVELVDDRTLQPFPDDDSRGSPVLALAAFAGSTRLIDNVFLGRDRFPEVS